MLKLIYCEVLFKWKLILFLVALAFVFAILNDHNLFFSQSSRDMSTDMLFMISAILQLFGKKERKYLAFIFLPIPLVKQGIFRSIDFVILALMYYPAFYLSRLAIGAGVYHDQLLFSGIFLLFIYFSLALFFLYDDILRIFNSTFIAFVLGIIAPISWMTALTLISGMVEGFSWIIGTISSIILLHAISVYTFIKRKSY